MVDRLACNEEAPGSNPGRSMNFEILKFSLALTLFNFCSVRSLFYKLYKSIKHVMKALCLKATSKIVIL
jgi:hypothetical protein